MGLVEIVGCWIVMVGGGLEDGWVVGWFGDKVGSYYLRF